MSKCVKCGNEILTGDIHWEMGLCNNCYNELYKDHKTHISLDKMWLNLAQSFRDENEKLREKISDIEAKLAECEKKAYSRGHSQRDIANEIKLNALREDVAYKEKRIVELKHQLEKSEKSKESYRLQNEHHHLQLLQFYSRLGVEAFGADIHEKALETLMIMKEQLAEKEKSLSIKSVVRTLMKDNNLNCTFRDKTNAQIQQCGDVYNSNYGYFNFEDDYDESLNNKTDNRFDITSIDLTNQDKISFAIAELEKVKELLNTDFESTISWIDSYEDGEYLNSMTYNHNNTIKTIDNQIKQLKEGK